VAYCWGANEDGQLGNGATTNSSSPVVVAGALKFSAVSAGGDHTCGVTTAGVAYCWGFNYYGELGTGSTTTAPQQCSSFPCSTMPVAVTGGLAFVAVSAGEQHSCGVTTSSQAYCWGFNGFGQLGNGSTTDSSSPVAVGGFNFQSVSAGLGNHAHSCGLTTGGVAYCWGANYSGQLGNGSTTNSSTPVRVVGQP
jgi:alpha-tubulin suppressor-like RCC1 family protein